MTPEGSDWSQPELVRAVTRLAASLEKFEDAVDQMFKDAEQRFVLRETYERDRAVISARHTNGQGWIRDLAAPIISGLILALVLVAARHLN